MWSFMFMMGLIASIGICNRLQHSTSILRGNCQIMFIDFMTMDINIDAIGTNSWHVAMSIIDIDIGLD